MEYDPYNRKCPTRQVLDQIANKWTVLVIGLLEDGPKRFSSIQRSVDGISQKMLTQTLRRLERDGLVLRTVFPVVPPHVEYELTELGKTIIQPIAEIRQWAKNNIEDIRRSQLSYDRKRNQA